MQKAEKAVSQFSRLMDNIACVGIVATMVLVVVNILLRTVFNCPIQGVYEYVGYLTAAVIGFALSRCALEKAHIAVGILVEKLPEKVQKSIDVITGSILFLFLAFVCWQVFGYGLRVMASGEVSATAHIPFYPFIFMIAAGIFALCLVELVYILKGVIVK